MCTENERAKCVRERGEQLESYLASYHHHKETMAHAGVGLQTALFAWVMSQDNPDLVGKTWLLVGFAVIWLLIHIYVRWQLRLRRYAAMQIDQLQSRLAQWSLQNPTSEELKPYPHPSSVPRVRHVLCDLLIPRFKYGIPLDEGRKDYPSGLVVLVDKSNKEWSLIKENPRLYCGEWLLSIGSFLMGGIVLVRGLLLVITDC